MARAAPEPVADKSWLAGRTLVELCLCSTCSACPTPSPHQFAMNFVSANVHAKFLTARYWTFKSSGLQRRMLLLLSAEAYVMRCTMQAVRL